MVITETTVCFYPVDFRSWWTLSVGIQVLENAVQFPFRGRFPRASPQSPRRFAPAGLSVDAIPAGVATFHSNQLIPLY